MEKQLAFSLLAMSLAMGLLLCVMLGLFFFQDWFLPAHGCGVKNETTLVCGNYAIDKMNGFDSIVGKGRELFEANCISCHSTKTDVVLGPGLKGIEERRDSIWIARFIKNSQAVIKSGDKYAIDLFEKYNKMQMTNFDFTDAEVWAILRYIRFANATIR